MVKRHLYDLLNLSPDATESEISRSYRRLALQYHPDRNPDGAEKFKELSTAYSILSDPEKKVLYDRTGVVSGGENLVSQEQRSAEMGAEVQCFFNTYRGSKEEEDDVIKSFKKCDGNFSKVIRAEVLFDNGKPDEIQRICQLVKRLIKEGKLTATEKWKETSTEKFIKSIEKKMAKERKEAEAHLKEMGLDSNLGEGNDGGMGALQALIQKRGQAEHEAMLANLEARYSNKGKKKRSRAEEVEAYTTKKHKKCP